jgi:hypothetical protein
LKPRRVISFSPAAEKARNNFREQWGENARVCLDWLEQETSRAPEDGAYVWNHRFTLAIEVNTKDGTFNCRAVYIFNDAAVQWLMFSHEFIPAK